MIKKLSRLLIILLVLSGIGYLFIAFIYPKYFYKPADLTIAENFTPASWYNPQIPSPPSLTLYEGHDQCYFAWNMMDSKLSFIDATGTVVWEKTAMPQNGPYCDNLLFFNTKDGTYTTFLRDYTFHLDYYDKTGNLVSEQEASIILSNLVIDVREEKPGFFDFKKKTVEPELFYGLRENSLLKYKLINYEGEEIFTYTTALQVLDIYKVSKEYYLLNFGQQITMLDAKGNQIWRKDYSNLKVMDYNFNGNILLVGDDSFVELVSFDGAKDLKLENRNNVVLNKTEDNNFFYSIASTEGTFSIEQYDSNLVQKTVIGPFNEISSFMVNGESLMFIGKTDTENNIYKFNVNGQEILKYVNSDNRILFFNDSLTLISDAESKMIGLNPDGTTAFTDGPFEVQGFYPADESVVFTYRDQNGNYSIKKIDDTGKQIFCRGTYEYIPTFVYTSNRSQTVYGYRTDNGTHLVVIDKKGTVMIDEVIFGINASRYNSRMPFGYETEVLYLRSDDKVTKIIFEKQVLSDRLIIW